MIYKNDVKCMAKKLKSTRFYISILYFFSVFLSVSQTHNGSFDKNKEVEDFEYELKHKNTDWFLNMNDGADYFSIKEKFDLYFSDHKWEKSKARSLGEAWLKSKLFYLDKNGKVQPEPYIQKHNNIPKNLNAVTSTTIIGTWRLLGPENSATTGYSGKGNHGGYVYLNRIDPTNSQKMFVSFVTGGLWMTSDGGLNWTLVDAPFSDVTYNDIDVCISNPQAVYALSNKELLRSIDGGLNWQSTSLNQTNYSGTPYDIAASPTNSNVVVARWGTFLYRTLDAGNTWSVVLGGLPNYSKWDCSIHSEMLDWSPVNTSEVFLLSTSNTNTVTVYKSSNSGLSFSALTTLTVNASVNGQIIGWSKLFLPSNNSSAVYVGMGTGTSAYAHQAAHLYKLNSTTGATMLSRINMIPGTSTMSLHHGDMVMDRDNENKIVYGTYSENILHSSLDNGLTFTNSVTNFHSDIRTIDLKNNKCLTGTDGESVFSTDGGNNNNTITNSISNHELWGFGSAFKSDIVASGNNHGPVMVKESANGFNWYNGYGADQGNTDVNPLDDRYIYSNGYSNYRFFRTGIHTLINESNFLDVGGIYSYFNSIEFHPNKYYTIITHHAGQYPTGNPNLNVWKNSLIKTEDNGNSISIVKTFTNQVFREKISMKNPNYIYVVEGLTNNKLWLTSDAGITWSNITPPSSVTSGQTNISDIAVSDQNPNEIWVAYSGVQSTCKIIKSTNFGSTWTNLTTSTLTSSPITKIIFQRGSNGGVYIGNKSGVYYRNNIMTNWQLLGSGLPQTEIRFMFINYNQGKLKIGTSRGAFEHDLYEISPPNALISANTNKVLCPLVDKIQFKDYSVVRNSSATWQWTFPGGTPSVSVLENPLVSYSTATNGFYNVMLTVTDAFGTSSQTLTNFIEVNNQCGSLTPDTIPGNIANLTGEVNGSYLEADNFNLNKNSFSFSCWIKPNGIQPDYSAIFMSQADASAFGLNFRSGNNTLGFHPSWSWSSGLIVPPGVWSHVAMVSNGTNVKLYLNGVEAVNNNAITTSVFSKINFGRYGRGWTGRSSTCEMDEVCIWNRPLTIDEIREFRHLTKSTIGNNILNGLVAYYQFNEAAGNLSLNKTINANHVTCFGNPISHIPSNAPVFGGVSEKVNVSNAGVVSFSNCGVTAYFASGIYPNGDVWVSRGNINPDQLPDLNTNFSSYLIFNNYGTNQSFTPLNKLTFTKNALFDLGPVSPSSYLLYKRGCNDFGATWNSSIDFGDGLNGSGINTAITFSSGLNVSSQGQFALSNTNLTSLISEKRNDVINPIIYPNPIKQGQPIVVSLPIGWEKTTLLIFDNLGKQLCTTTLKQGLNNVLLNVSRGEYQILFFSYDKKFTSKLIVE